VGEKKPVDEQAMIELELGMNWLLEHDAQELAAIL